MNCNKQKSGFTMLEMIVALGVFATVAVLSVSALLSLTSAQKKALALQSVQDNLRFSLESMARDIRQGDFFYCGATLQDFPPVPLSGQIPETKDCPVVAVSAGRAITFLDRRNKVTTYRLGDANALNDSSTSSCGEEHLCIEKATRANYGEPLQFSPVTSKDIEIRRFDIYVTGSARDDITEPRITLVVEGVAGAGRDESDFQLQTTVSGHRNIFRD